MNVGFRRPFGHGAMSELSLLCAQQRTSIWRIRQGRNQIISGANPSVDVGDHRHQLRATGEGQRILSGPIVEKFAMRADGQLELATEGSTRPVSSIVTHAGICKTRRFSFDMPSVSNTEQR